MSQVHRSLSLVVVAAALLVTGCITRTVLETVVHDDGVQIKLRGLSDGGESVPRDFEHPAIISPQRLARVLGSVEVEVGEGDDRARTGIMDYSLLTSVSRGMARALEKADTGQEIVVMAIRKERRTVALFHKLYLTSFVAYVKDGELAIHLSKVNWEVPKNGEDDLPVPHLGDDRGEFRMVPIRGMRRMGPQSIAARYRDPMFGRALGRRPADPSQVKRRTILMESRLPVGDFDEELTPEQLESLSATALQALEDLQIARENGEITEDEYRRSRDDLLGVER